MGLGQLLYGQIGKGVLYLSILILTIIYFVIRGAKDITGFFTLGTKKADPWLGIEGDNSVVMLLMGIFAFIVLAFFIYCYFANIRDIKNTQKRVENGENPL